MSFLSPTSSWIVRGLRTQLWFQLYPSLGREGGLARRSVSPRALLPHLQVVKVTSGLEHAVRATLEIEAKDPGELGF